MKTIKFENRICSILHDFGRLKHKETSIKGQFVIILFERTRLAIFIIENAIFLYSNFEDFKYELDKHYFIPIK